MLQFLLSTEAPFTKAWTLRVCMQAPAHMMTHTHARSLLPAPGVAVHRAKGPLTHGALYADSPLLMVRPVADAQIWQGLLEQSHSITLNQSDLQP